LEGRTPEGYQEKGTILEREDIVRESWSPPYKLAGERNEWGGRA